MRMRITSLEEKQLQECLLSSLWGSKHSFKDWEIGDILVLCVNKEIAAVAKVSGPQFISSTPIWENGLFPIRMPLIFTHYFKQKNRLPLQGELREMFYNVYGQKYGLVYLNKMLLDPKIAAFIMGEIASKPNNLDSFKTV